MGSLQYPLLQFISCLFNILSSLFQVSYFEYEGFSAYPTKVAFAIKAAAEADTKNSVLSNLSYLFFLQFFLFSFFFFCSKTLFLKKFSINCKPAEMDLAARDWPRYGSLFLLCRAEPPTHARSIQRPHEPFCGISATAGRPGQNGLKIEIIDDHFQIPSPSGLCLRTVGRRGFFAFGQFMSRWRKAWVAGKDEKAKDIQLRR